MEQIRLFSLQPKIERSKELFKMFEEAALRMDPGGYYLSFSGGKDSQVIYHLAKMAGVKFQPHYHITTVDPPELVQFIKRDYPDVVRDMPRESMWKLIVRKQFPPTRQIRYCCSELKERGAANKFLVTGVRWEESRRRKAWDIAQIENGKKEHIVLLNDNHEKRRNVEHCQLKGRYILNPILDWTEEDVWSFLYQQGISYCSLYDCGFSRLGCIGCPMVSLRKRKWELERYPKYRQAYLNAFERMLERRTEEKKSQNPWNTPEEVLDWWLYGRIKKESPIMGQIHFWTNEAGEIAMKKGKEELIEGKVYEEWMQEFENQKYMWEQVKQFGSPKEMWSDGITLAHIRDELLHIQEILQRYREADDMEIPPKVSKSYMAGAEDIRLEAKRVTEEYLSSENYHYLCEQESVLGKRQLKTTNLPLLLGQIQAFVTAVEEDNLVIMRKFIMSETFHEKLQDMTNKIRLIVACNTDRKEKCSCQDNMKEEQITGQISIYELAS